MLAKARGGRGAIVARGGATARAGPRRPWAPRAVLALAAVLAFGAGMHAVWARSLPWRLTRDAVKSLAGIVAASAVSPMDLGVAEFVDVPADSVAANRVRLFGDGPLRDRIVLGGGRWHFGERCGGMGCLAVEYAGAGQAGRATPIAPDLLGAGPEPPAGVRWEKTPGVDGSDVITPFWLASYANGDLLVVLEYMNFHFPPYAGVARVNREGRLLWRRRDYSHHEPWIGAGDTAWIATASLESEVQLPGDLGKWRCDDGPSLVDAVQGLDENGNPFEEISLVEAFAASPWASLLVAAEPCDPFHLNSVARVGGDFSGSGGARPGDFVLSLRNLSAVALLDGRTHALKRLVRGTFARQHSVKHLRGSQFVLFDNQGGRGRRSGTRYAYSRVLVVDLATGDETVLFPMQDSERYWNWWSGLRGRISLSPDRTRLIAAFTELDKVVEVRIEDGEPLAEFDFAHDVRRFTGSSAADSSVARFGLAYAFYDRESSR